MGFNLHQHKSDPAITIKISFRNRAINYFKIKIMTLTKVLLQRFSVRKYKKQKIEKDKLIQVLEAGRIAPSAVNYQPCHFIVLQEAANLDKIYTVYNREWIKSAPAAILICADHNESWKRKADGKDSADIDIAIAADHMTLKATEIGLGTCWVCNFDAPRCSEIFELPPHIEPLVILPIGYPDIEAPEKKRKKPDEIVHWEKF